MNHQLTTPGRGPQRGTVTCKEDPGQTCYLKDQGNGVFLCKCFPTECGSPWAGTPGCNTITWKEPVIEPQSRPPARGRPASVPPPVWKRLKRRGWNAIAAQSRRSNPAPSQVLSVPAGQQGAVTCPTGYELQCWDDPEFPGTIQCQCWKPGCDPSKWYEVCLATPTPDTEPAPQCRPPLKWCQTLGTCVPLQYPCPAAPDLTAQPRPLPKKPQAVPLPGVPVPPVPHPRPRPVGRPSSVPRPPPRGAQIQRAAMAVGNPNIRAATLLLPRF